MGGRVGAGLERTNWSEPKPSEGDVVVEVGVKGGGAKPQSRPQPAAFDTDLDDDVPF